MLSKNHPTFLKVKNEISYYTIDPFRLGLLSVIYYEMSCINEDVFVELFFLNSRVNIDSCQTLNLTVVTRYRITEADLGHIVRVSPCYSPVKTRFSSCISAL